MKGLNGGKSLLWKFVIELCSKGENWCFIYERSFLVFYCDFSLGRVKGRNSKDFINIPTDDPNHKEFHKSHQPINNQLSFLIRFSILLLIKILLFGGFLRDSKNMFGWTFYHVNCHITIDHSILFGDK